MFPLIIYAITSVAQCYCHSVYILKFNIKPNIFVCVCVRVLGGQLYIYLK